MLAVAGVSRQRVSELQSSPEALPTAAEAVAISQSLGVPLHPWHTPRFDRVGAPELAALRKR